MVSMVEKMKLSLIGGICAIAVTACAPSYHVSADEQAGYGGYGYDQAQYGYDYVADQSSYSSGYDQNAYGYGEQQGFNTAYRSRYGDVFAGESALRGSCGTSAQGCGMMAVVPVYPVYQVYTAPAPQALEVEIFETPTVTLPEPEVTVYEPEPVYEPPVYEPVTNYWPEPEAPVTTWAPLRK